MAERIKGRVKGLLSGPPQEEMYVDMTPGLPDPDAQRRALQVLTLAQRTADEHVASAQQQADSIRNAARSQAEQIVREAQAHADGVRRDGDEALAAARAKATDIVKEAQNRADGLDREAKQRYEDVVGTLETKRDALQQEIDTLQQFDRDYRTRLRTFMRNQLDALGDEDGAPSSPSVPRPAGAGRTGVQRVPQET